MNKINLELNAIIEEAHKSGWTEDLETEFLAKGEEELLLINEKTECTTY